MNPRSLIQLNINQLSKLQSICYGSFLHQKNLRCQSYRAQKMNQIYQNANNAIFFQEFKIQVNANIHFLMKVIFNILYNIKKYIKFDNYMSIKC